MASYRLSRRVENDLLDIYVYGIEQFGETQAERYHLGNDALLRAAGRAARMGREATVIGEGVRRDEHGSHVILYEIASDGVLILAIVHGRSVRRLKI